MLTRNAINYTLQHNHARPVITAYFPTQSFLYCGLGTSESRLQHACAALYASCSQSEGHKEGLRIERGHQFGVDRLTVGVPVNFQVSTAAACLALDGTVFPSGPRWGRFELLLVYGVLPMIVIMGEHAGWQMCTTNYIMSQR
jgi:hypothetical protein